MIHELKLQKQFFNDVRFGAKTAEIRRADRGFKVGDKILFKEVFFGGNETGYSLRLECLITHIVEGGQFGIHNDYVMLSIKLISYYMAPCE